MDRIAEFHPAFREFLDAQVRLDHEEQQVRRFRDEETGRFSYTKSEWRPVYVPDYVQEAMPQTLSEEDIRLDRWPAPIYIFRFKSGRQMVSKIQATREFHGLNITMDFMTVVDRLADGTEKPLPEFDWSPDEINNTMPGARGARGLELREPEVINPPRDKGHELLLGEGAEAKVGISAGAPSDPATNDQLSGR